MKRDSKVDHTCVACFGALTDKILHTRHVRNGQEAQSICNRNIMGRWAGSCSWSAFIAGIVIMPHLVANQIVRAPTAKGGRCEHFLGAVNQASATRPQRDRNETAVSRSLVSCSDEMVYEFLGWSVRGRYSEQTMQDKSRQWEATRFMPTRRGATRFVSATFCISPLTSLLVICHEGT